MLAYAKEACKYYKMAADQGHAKSMRLYAIDLYDGDGIEKDSEAAIEFFKKN